MALANFFDRIYGAVGKHLAVGRVALARALDNTVITVECGSELLPNERMIAEMVINLLSRLYPRLRIIGSPDDVAYLARLASSINPCIELGTGLVAGITIHVGSPGTEQGLYPCASGWAAVLNHSAGRSCGPTNPYSSAAAAAMACSELFRRVFFNASPERDTGMSLLDFSTDAGGDLELREISLGEVLFVGVGAVGNAALWRMARDATTTGVFHAIDPETLDPSNLQRYVLAAQEDVHVRKVDIAAKAMIPSRLQLLPHGVALEDFQPERK